MKAKNLIITVIVIALIVFLGVKAFPGYSVKALKSTINLIDDKALLNQKHYDSVIRLKQSDSLKLANEFKRQEKIYQQLLAEKNIKISNLEKQKSYIQNLLRDYRNAPFERKFKLFTKAIITTN